MADKNNEMKQVKDRFDEPDFSSPLMTSFNCIAGICPQEQLVKHYGWIGLHRYNLLKGTKFVLSHLIRYNRTMSCCNSYYITLSAWDESHKIFQVQVDEDAYGVLDVVCSVARVRGDTTEPSIYPSAMDRLPDWPSADAFRDFYLVEGSELRHNDWIHMYLELAVIGYDRCPAEEEGFFSNLEVVKAAIETTESSPLNASSATIYLTFKGLAIGDQTAIIKRVLDQSTGFFYLKGSLCFGGRPCRTDEPWSSTTWEDICNQNS